MKYASYKIVHETKRKFLHDTYVVVHNITTYMTYIQKLSFDYPKSRGYGVYVRMIIYNLSYRYICSQPTLFNNLNINLRLP